MENKNYEINSGTLFSFLSFPRLFHSWQKDAVSFTIFVLIYVFIIAWFYIVDVYHNYFFIEASKTYFTYSLFRVVYMIYLAWMLYFIGTIILKYFNRRGAHFSHNLLDRFVLCFFVGGAALHIVLYVLGFMKLYYRGVAVCLTVSIVILSYSEFRVFRRGLVRALQETYNNYTPFIQKHTLSLMLALCSFLAFFLMVLKGLSPHFTGDYITHYFPYYRQVVELHSIWPNNVWYHYYFSKGAGVFFMSMLLTDLNASQLVSFVYFIASALALFSLIRLATASSLWALMGVALYIAGFVYTPAWGSFEKQHIVMTSLIGATAWMTVMFDDRTEANRKAWIGLSVLVIANLIIFAPTAFPLVFLVYALMGAVFLIIKMRYVRARSFMLIAVSGLLVMMIGVFGINYLQTGLAEITPPRFFWKYADQEKFSNWVSPYLMVVLSEGSRPTMGDFVPVDLKNVLMQFQGNFYWYYRLFRLHTVRFLFANKVMFMALISIILFLLLDGRRPRYKFKFCRVIFPIFVILFIAFWLSFSVDQPVSIWRYYTFTVFFTVIISLLAWALLEQLMTNRVLKTTFSYLFPVVIVCWATIATVRGYPKDSRDLFFNYVIGKVSFANLYERCGILWNPVVEIRKIIGPKPRIYCFNYHLYMGPDAQIETFFSYSFYKKFHEIAFESPERAKELLRQQGLNYFLVDVNRPFFGLLPCSPLFQPENIQKHMGVAWNEGRVYLLTWLSSSTQPISQEFIDGYLISSDPNRQNADYSAIYERVKLIYDSNKGKPYPIRIDPNLPQVRGWQ